MEGGGGGGEVQSTERVVVVDLRWQEDRGLRRIEKEEEEVGTREEAEEEEAVGGQRRTNDDVEREQSRCFNIQFVLPPSAIAHPTYNLPIYV